MIVPRLGGGRPPGRDSATHTAARSGPSAAPGTRTRHRGNHEHSGDAVTCKRGEVSAYRRHLMVRPPVPVRDLAASQHMAGLASDPALRSYPWEGRRLTRSPAAVRPDEGPLIEPTAATRPWRRLPLFMPRSRHWICRSLAIRLGVNTRLTASDGGTRVYPRGA